MKQNFTTDEVLETIKMCLVCGQLGATSEEMQKFGTT